MNKCNCTLCQVGRKSLAEHYAYCYAKAETIRDAIKYLKRAKIKPVWSEKTTRKEILSNWLWCVEEDLAGYEYAMEEIEQKYPKFKNWITKPKD